MINTFQSTYLIYTLVSVVNWIMQTQQKFEHNGFLTPTDIAN